MVVVDYLPLLVVSFAASLGLTPLSRQIAKRLGVVDNPSARKVHLAPIPLMGGLAIYGAFVLAVLLFFSGQQNVEPHIVELGAILICVTWLALIGLIDDRIDLRPKFKFPAQILAAVVVIAAGVRIELFNNGLDLALTLVWIVGLINAANFLDNMDGLAAGVSAIAAFFLFVLSLSQGQVLVSGLAAALCGAAVGFLIYNFNPATTFMGDMGSMVLGFTLAVLGIKLRFARPDTIVTWMIPVVVLGLPIFDTTLVVLSRLREGRSPLKGGKDHTSHRLVVMGLSHRAAVVVLYSVCVALGIAAILISQSPTLAAMLIGGGLAVCGAIAFVVMEVVRIRQLRQHKKS
jgi:UDP-GlcNAc:undecaprenyl-phosphate GlcNAc-1-phosphate transferase